jgi:asparagine synthase (glutamine-hydrolysing)
MIYERAFKWLFEGEDRNRFYFWTVAPFYSAVFFQYAMKCPQKQKADFELYREFFRILSPSLASIENANWRTPLIGRKYFAYSVYRSIVNKLPTGFKRYIKNRLRSPLSPLYADCVREQYKRCRMMNEHLPWAFIDKLLRRSRDRKQIETIFTFTSLNEELQTGYSTITEYSDHPLT